MGSFEEGSAAPGPFLLPSVLTAGLLLYIFFFFFFKCLFVQVELAGAGVSGRALCAHPDLEAARGEQGEPPVMTCGRRPLLLLSLQGPAQAGTPFWHCRRRALAQFSSEGRKPKRQLRARGSGVLPVITTEPIPGPWVRMARSSAVSSRASRVSTLHHGEHGHVLREQLGHASPSC